MSFDPYAETTFVPAEHPPIDLDVLPKRVLFAWPPEPPIGTRVELRGKAMGEGRFVSVDDKRTPEAVRGERRWAPTHIPNARHIDRYSWQGLLEYAIRYRCEVVEIAAEEDE